MKPIIIEGPDGIGKTTAIKRLEFMLRDRFNAEPIVEHLSKEDVIDIEDEEEALHYFTNRLHDAHEASGGYSIYDRFHIGSWVYGFENHLHKTWIADEASFARVSREIAKKAFVVVMYDSRNYVPRVTKLFQQREEMFDLEQCIAVNESYVDLESHPLQDDRVEGNVLTAHIFHDVNYIGYPMDAQLEYWIEEASKL